jgi:hypothetical protein
MDLNDAKTSNKDHNDNDDDETKKTNDLPNNGKMNDNMDANTIATAINNVTGNDINTYNDTKQSANIELIANRDKNGDNTNYPQSSNGDDNAKISNDNATNIGRKPYVYENATKNLDAEDGSEDNYNKQSTRGSKSNERKQRPNMNKALKKLGHDHTTGKVDNYVSSRRGSLQDAVLGVIGRRRAQFRKENRALSFRSKQPSNVKPWKDVPWGILSYQDPKRIGWDVLVFLLLIYIALVTPIRIGFDQEASQTYEPFFYYLEKAIDIIFILDIMVNFCTSYADDKNKEIVDHRKIAINYLQTWFFLDFISSIPVDWIMESQGGSDGLGNIQVSKFYSPRPEV